MDEQQNNPAMPAPEDPAMMPDQAPAEAPMEVPTEEAPAPEAPAA